jgi:hypothetical protein
MRENDEDLQHGEATRNEYREFIAEDIMPKLRILADIRKAIQEWSDKQDDDKSWNYSEIFHKIRELLEIGKQPIQLPDPNTFLRNCANYYLEQHPSETGQTCQWKVGVMPEVPKDCILAIQLNLQKMTEIIPAWEDIDQEKRNDALNYLIRSLKGVYSNLKPGDIFIYTDAIEVVGVAKISVEPQVEVVDECDARVNKQTDKGILIG